MYTVVRQDAMAGVAEGGGDVGWQNWMASARAGNRVAAGGIHLIVYATHNGTNKAPAAPQVSPCPRQEQSKVCWYQPEPGTFRSSN